MGTIKSKHMGSKKYQLLVSVVQAVHRGDQATAQGNLSELMGKHLDVEQHPEDLLYYVFASALTKRFTINAQDEINLYLKQYEMSQIDLFNLVATHLQNVYVAAYLSNLHLSRYFVDQGDVTLVNIGIGTGRQELTLLQLLEQQGALPRKLTIHAIEPFTDALQAAEQAIGAACQQLGVELKFHSYLGVAEQLADAVWAGFVPENETLLVNASFALHHIRGLGDETGLRQSIFDQIRKLNPTSVVICEPHSDHYNSDLQERFENCWHHFSTVFAYIDGLGLPKEEVIGLKMFFAREIEDIIGNREERRYERHERAEVWVKRMRDAGFRMYDEIDVLGEVPVRAGVELKMYDGYVGVDYEGETLIGVMCGIL